uniref:histidine--tRNA ligase n=1 Tax=uncultured prokaryote TaxID=198431 RepID=H5SLH2_9ZZZZ|nr:histidyl-tRNA synthetase [uncultured prokaryote]
MAPLFRAPRGTQDILPPQQPWWRLVISRAEETARRFGYRRIDTPIFEQAGLFVRSVGAGTDIVEKETYTFTDRGGEEMTLRAEGTAPICRAYLEHGMHTWPQPVRLYYICPIFRYERPQAGRYRQHHQFGVEAIGDPSPAIDAEVIELGWRFLTDASFGLGLQNLTLLVNSIGCPQDRPAYVQRLRAYYEPLLPRLCPDCQGRRFHKAPLRLLDCKQESCQALAQNAPRSVDFLCPACREHWETLKALLRILDIPFTEEHRLVRGLDYYTRTVFEIQPPEERAQAVVMGGGRYDGLIEELGGKPTPGIGFGSGIERLVLQVQRQALSVPQDAPPDVVVAFARPDALSHAFLLASRLRQQGLCALLAPQRSLKGQLRWATALQARYALLLGDVELQKGTVVVKDMGTGEQWEVPQQEVGARLRPTN